MKKIITFGKWLDAVAIKTVKTMAQTCVGIIAACAIVQEIDWKFIISACAVSGLVTMLTCVDTLPEYSNEDIAQILGGENNGKDSAGAD